MCAREPRKISVFGRASPSGAIAGWLAITYVWPYDLCTSRCSSCVVAGSSRVGVVGGVGLEVLEHDREQILAREAAATRSESGATATGFEL